MKHIFVFLIAVTFFGCSRPESKNAELLEPVAFATTLKADPSIILLDVRTPEELNDGYIGGALNLDFNSPDFKNSLEKLDHSKSYFVYCASGKRSGKAKDIMKEMGFQRITAMEGGLHAWTAAGLPLNKP